MRTHLITQIAFYSFCLCAGLAACACSNAPSPSAITLDDSLDPLSVLLQQNPDFHVLAYEDIGKWQQWVRNDELAATGKADTNGDGLQDLVAVLVRGAGETRAYGVAAFHGLERQYSTEPVWVVDPSMEPILGVDTSEQTIRLIVCYGCDYVPTFHWSGEGYETGIRLPGARECISPGTVLYSNPDVTAAVLFKQGDDFGYVEVLQLSHKTANNTRWHKVRLLEASTDSPLFENMKPIVPEVFGFIDSVAFFNDVGC